MSATPRHTFPKTEKLKSRKQIDLLFREGKSFFAAPIKSYYLIGNRQSAIGNRQWPMGKTESPKVEELQSETTKVNVENVHESSTSNIRRPARTELVEGKPQTSAALSLSNVNLPKGNLKHQTSNLLAGVSVSKRNFKHSVDRNRIKRLLREAYRIHKHALQEKLDTQNKTLEVFFVFTYKTQPTFALVEEKMKYCIRRLGKIVEGIV